MKDNNTDTRIPRTGYDLPVYGLKDGTFYTLHTIAISCLSLSLVCGFITVILSFRIQDYKGFFTQWQKRDRFVIYIAMFDIVYCGCHLADHMHVLIGKDHVYPKAMCVLYAFIMLLMTFAQILLVNMIAINMFALIYFGYNMNFGKHDWKLLTWILGSPAVCLGISSAFGGLGPTGAYCAFDAVAGNTLYIGCIAVQHILILLVNSLLYLLTWLKLYSQLKAIKTSMGRTSAGMKAAQTVAKSTTMFLTAYIVRWWAAALFAGWTLTNTTVPQVVIQLVVFFSNIGGILNVLVSIMLRCGRSGITDNTVH